MLQMKEIMNASVTTISSSQLIGHAIKLFRQSKLHAIFVVDDNGILVGMLTLSNLFDALLRGQSLQEPIEGCYLPKNKIVFFPKDKQFSNLIQVQEWLLNAKVSETPVIDDDGRPIGVVTQVCVINALLKEIMGLYDQIYSLLKVVPTGILAVNESNVITVCNRLSEELLGLEASKVIGRNLKDIIPELNLDNRGPQKIKRNTASILAASRHISLEPIYGHIVVMYDATEVERMAQEVESIKRLQSTFETILNTAYEGLLVVNDEGRVILANHSFEQLIKM